MERREEDVFLSKSSIIFAGKYFVAAELSRYGYMVSMKIGYLQSVDIFVEKNNKVFKVQVLTIRNIKSGNWKISKNSVLDDVIYVFVNLNLPDSDRSPDFYVLTSAEVRSTISFFGKDAKEGITEGKIKRITPPCKNNWSKIEKKRR